MGAPDLNKPFSMPMFRAIVPRNIRPWIYVFFAFSFQLSGGIYIGSLNEMFGGMSLMREDILMCMYANLCGMAMYFPLLFRMKFRFTNKTLLFVSFIMIAICNYLAMYITFLPLLWFVCFVSGCFKIQGTFECMSNIQLWMTPKRDFTVFFPVLHIIILCSIQFSDLIAVYLCYISNWQYMHWLMVGILLFDALLVFVLTRHVRIIPKMPLFGIDWLGAVIWAALVLEIVYLFNYGEWYDWWNSNVIQILSFVIIFTLLLALHRMFRIRHPYYEPKMWKYRNLAPLLILIAIIEGILATEHILEEVFYEEGMRYITLTSTTLNLAVVVGILIGCLFSLLWMKVLKFSFLKLINVGLGGVVAYLVLFYFIISTEINFELLYFPLVMRGFSYAVLSIVFITSLEEIMTFQHFFQSLSVFNIMHMMIGGVIGCSIYTYGLRYFVADNISRYSGNIDRTTTDLASLNHIVEQFYINMQMISLKEIYGLVAYFAITLFILMLLYDLPYTRSTLKRMPGWKSIGIMMRRSFKKVRS
ncbi:MAG: hypothetical protein PHR45_02820 [Muribaculaceae bacterium]|nr:hypothetical protein [Muribaculaceae bacterium]